MSSSRRRREPFNIIPVDNLPTDRPYHSNPAIRAVITALLAVGNLRRPPGVRWRPSMDLLDWLALFFGFQRDSVRNQREHLVLHLANAQLRLIPPPEDLNTLDPGVLRLFSEKLLKNYAGWCSYLNKDSNIWISHRRNPDVRRELLYVSLYLLIWGEAANLRFMPECICFIFHNMAMELNKILDDYIDEKTEQLVMPSYTGENAFLNSVVKPIYDTLKDELGISKNGTAPHKSWRNYDDINEYFWSRRCFEKLKWPIDLGSDFFAISGQPKYVGKTGFVEQRSFLHLFRSFDRLFVMLILFLQASIIVACQHTDYPWQALQSRDVQVHVLTIFLTWAGLRLVQSLLDIGMQFRLVSRETVWLGLRMVLKIVVAAVWIVVFRVFYRRIWSQKTQDGRWSDAANRRVLTFLELAGVFVLPESLAIVLSIVPWVRSFLENTNWTIFNLLLWWYQSRSYVGRGVREGLADYIKYSLFWIVVLATKFAFSYFLQIKPMIKPSELMLDLKDVEYAWHAIFNNNNRLAVAMLWLPVVLIYLMDLQVWYSIYSSFVGAAVGLFAHLGEIRNIQQLRLRFQFFAGAFQYNLMSEEQSYKGFIQHVKSHIKESIHLLKLRYGLRPSYKKLESNQIEANKFTLVWNEIIMIFREEDIISDLEIELLELPHNSWNVSVIRWPCFLLCNELFLALSQAKELVGGPDKWLWYKISKNEYRRCAVIEAYDSVKHLLLEIIKANTKEHSIVAVLLQKIDHSLQTEKFSKTFNMTALPNLHAKLIELVDLLKKPTKDVNQVVNTLQALYEIVVRDFFIDKRTVKQLKEDGLVPRDPAVMSGNLFESAVELPNHTDETFYRNVRRLYTIIIPTSRYSMQNVPRNLEARRRIAFFSNSVFMRMPLAPQVEKMMAFSVLTPYYNEEVVYSRNLLEAQSDDGISTLKYLKTIHLDEWANFLSRMKRGGLVDYKFRDVQLWASYRGQTLSRTVRGMMYYHRALKMLAFLDSASEMDIKEDTLSRSNSSSSVSSLLNGHAHETAMMKFTFVVACQIYGTQKENEDPRAKEILDLMKNNDALRVAYVDEVKAKKENDAKYYSVLVKYDAQLDKEVEIYRVELPGPIKLGEGKPENQNHALIFTRGDAVQTIDMNQDNYFEEALKMRNLLQEYRHYYGIRKPTILGVREHIFTGSVSSLSWFMSAQEMSFVTLGQRVLANPLKVRMHYGHPDVFDRFWFLTRGGLSKASRVINISEDIFAGYNCTLRGGNVTHHEYIQVGKGRDVGLNQISMFEAKVASGNGEQVLSRDVYRLGHRLDFFRMLSFFYTTVGFYFNTMVVILTVYAFLWGRIYLALSGVEGSALANSSNNKSLGAILNQQFIIQLGIFTALPMIVENSLEQGFVQAIWDFLIMQLQLSSVFYTFSMGTRSHFFGRTILHGGAKYRPTGRGFVLTHTTFSENYRLYARSHFIKAIELGFILAVYASNSPVAKDTLVYILLTVSSWFLVASWLMAPFVFNPSGFDKLKIANDYEDFMNWIWYKGSVFAKAEQSWEKWLEEEQDYLRTTGHLGKCMEVVLNIRFFFLQFGIVYQLGIADKSTSISVYLVSWVYNFVVVGAYVLLTYAHRKYAVKKHIYYRLVQFIVTMPAILVMIALLVFTSFRLVDLFSSCLAFIPTGWGLLSIAQVFRPWLKNSKSTLSWELVVSLARLYEIMFGVIVMMPVAVLSWMPGFQTMQTRILYSRAFSKGLRLWKIVARFASTTRRPERSDWQQKKAAHKENKERFSSALAMEDHETTKKRIKDKGKAVTFELEKSPNDLSPMRGRGGIVIKEPISRF